MERTSESGFPVDPVYDASKLTDFQPEAKLGRPGEYPFTRGVYPRMYVDRPWTMRQYAGFATASESNRRYHELIEAGTTGLSVAFDLPTQMGYDSDAPAAHGEVGKVGVAIDSVADMRALFDGIGLDAVSTSMTINAPAAVLLLMYQTAGEEQGAAADKLTGTIQNDVLKEYIARGTYIYPPRPSLRLVADTFAYCRAELPRWNTISISGYHMAEAGATAVLGGTQSLHTNSFDEALALPSTKAARLALRTQQVIAYESDLTATVDPFAGSYAIEAMTDEIEAAAGALMDRIEEMGGAAAAIERGFQKAEIESAAYQVAREIADGEEPYQPLRVDPAIEAAKAEHLAQLRQARDSGAVSRAISALKTTAEGTGNVLYPLRDALRADATLGEVCDALRDIWGEYHPSEM
jgi:methylmalonyl-CoA mutase N-terminal domain/subunit